MATQSPWLSLLQTASFGGVPFAVERTEATLGRRIVPHLYPFRDKPYFEDMGAAPKYYTFDGYLLGDDVQAQRRRFEAILNTPGNQTLVHPSRGSMRAMLQTASFLEDKENGRVVKCRLSFAVADDRASPLLYPANRANTAGLTAIASLNLGAASALGFLSALNGALAEARGAINQVSGAINGVLAGVQNTRLLALSAASGGDAIGATLAVARHFAGLLGGTAQQVLGIVGAVRGIGLAFSGLDINFGRYSAGQISRPSPVLATIDQTLPLASRLAAATAALLADQAATVASIGAAAAAALLVPPTTPPFPAAVQALVEGARLNCNDPADQISLLCDLASYPSAAPAQVAGPQAAVQGMAACAALCRQAALLSLANATRDYQPTSSTATGDLIATIAPLFDLEAEYAADIGDLATYGQLRQTRAAIITDLQTRGSQLPPLATFNLNANLPSLALAYRLYADSSRADDLIARADPVNPAFFPRTFVALSA